MNHASTGPRHGAPLAGKCVFVNGGGRGIGRGIALAAASRGAAVLATDVDEAAAMTVAAEIGERGGIGLGARCDVTNTAAVRAALAMAQAQFGSIDAVIHNAIPPSAAEHDPIDNADEQIWHDQVAIGLRAMFHLARLAHDALRASRGSLLVMVSKAGFTGVADQASYAAVKGAQRGFVRALAREWGPAGIRVNGLSPSALTPALATYLAANPAMEHAITQRAALRRMGDPEGDIGAAACFLIGPDSRFVTGQTLVVDGGGLMP